MSRLQPSKKTLTLVPLTATSVLVAAGLLAVGSGGTATSADKPRPLPGGGAVPAVAVQAPASVSRTPGISRAEADEAVATASASGIPSAALRAYQRAETVINAAAPACNLPWQLIAAIGRVESDHGRYGGSTLGQDGRVVPGIYGIALNGKNKTRVIRDTDGGELDNDTTYDRAVGPMQFIPTTWQVVGVDADEDGTRDPQDIDDAALSTAVYLCSGKTDLSSPSGLRGAVLRYNHSESYVDLVLSIMHSYQSGDFESLPTGVVAAGDAAPFAAPRPYEITSTGKRIKRTSSTPTGTTSTGPTTGPTSGPTSAPPTAPTTSAPSTPPSPPPTHVPSTPPTKLPTKLPTSVPTVIPTVVPTVTSVPTIVTGVLTLVEATAKCLAEGKVDNLLDSNDAFDQCVYAYTH
ncbi:MAG: lytic murein transglycosylase [Nocardioides sp.]|jgi:hypothetical protein